MYRKYLSSGFQAATDQTVMSLERAFQDRHQLEGRAFHSIGKTGQIYVIQINIETPPLDHVGRIDIVPLHKKRTCLP